MFTYTLNAITWYHFSILKNIIILELIEKKNQKKSCVWQSTWVDLWHTHRTVTTTAPSDFISFFPVNIVSVSCFNVSREWNTKIMCMKNCRKVIFWLVLVVLGRFLGRNWGSERFWTMESPEFNSRIAIKRTKMAFYDFFNIPNHCIIRLTASRLFQWGN